MTKPLTLGSLLLITTALIAPAALAQTSPPVAASPPASGQDTGQPTPDQADDPEAEVEISSPGGDETEVEEIVVRGRFIPEPVRNTPEVVSVLSAADIARTGEGDIAGALGRVTGLSVVGNGFVYVRGLGDRYSLALLNGSPLPSPEPLKRVVPLDIFPTSVIASAVVQKSYSVNYPGEFGGGVINLTTKSIPDEGFLTIGGGVGGDSETTFELGYTYFGSDSDFTGFDDGSRDVPGLLQGAFDSGNLIVEGANFTRPELQAITSSLANANTSVLQTNRNIPVNFSGNVTFGETFDVGDGQLGIIGTVGLNNSWRTRDARQQSSLAPDLSGTLARDFRAVITENRVVANALLGFGYEFGDQKIRFTNLFIRDTIKQGRLSRGFDTTALESEIITQNTFWFERQLFESQLVGEFKFDDLSVDLRGTYANSQREAPYERSFSYAFDDGVDDFVNDLTSAGQSARIAFSDLNEDLYFGGIDFGYRLAAIDTTLTAGYAYTKTERSSTRREFRFLPGTPLGPARQLRPDFLLSDVSVQAYNIQLVETSGQSGVAAFDAELEIHGGYVQAEATVIEGVSVAAGVRYETADQSVTPIDLFGTGGGSTPTGLSNEYFLPAATVTWNFAEDMQLRFAASRTIARPQFRELAFQLYQDPESDRQFFGNPFLQDSKLTNAEARYEWYFARGERLTVAGFYKKIDNPIETFGFFAGGNTLQTSFANAPEASLYGAELEVVKYVPLDSFSEGDFFASRRLVLIGNYTYTKSELKVEAGDTTIFPLGNGDPTAADALFTDGEPLTGQSDHIVNLQIGLEDTDRLSQQTLLLSYASERVTNRGPNAGSGRQPDIVEKPGLRLDFVARQGLAVAGQDIEFKFEVRNITGQGYEEFQEANGSRVDVNTYDVGTSVSLGLEVKF